MTSEDGGIGQDQKHGTGRVEGGVDGRQPVRVETDRGEEGVHQRLSAASRIMASRSLVTSSVSVPSKWPRTWPLWSISVSLLLCRTRLPGFASGASFFSTPSNSRLR